MPKDGDQNNMPVTRDEHSAVVYKDCMVIFGGFAFGERTNTLYKYNFKKNVWEKLYPVTESPRERVGHSAVV